MLQRKILRLLPVAFLSMILVACGADKGNYVNSENTMYRDTFTAEELDKGVAEFHITEDIYVDASLTDSSIYKRNFNSYYIEHIYECKGGESQKLKQNPTIYHKNYNEISSWVNSIIPGAFKDKDFHLDLSAKDEPNICAEYESKDNTNYLINAFWDSYDEAFGNNDTMFCPFMNIDIQPGISNLNSLFYSLENNVEDYQKCQVDYISDMDGTAKKYKEKIEELTGRTLCDKFDTVALTKESVEALNQVNGFVEKYAGKDLLMLKYYYQIDGLPYKPIYLTYKLKPGEKASMVAMMSTSENSLLCGLAENPQKVILSKDGVYGIYTTSFRYPEKTYRKNLKIISPNNVLKKIKQYYDKTILLDTITIKDISLVYAGYFSDFVDGTIEPIVTPVWDVALYDNKAGSFVHFVYDAVTGKSYLENAYV